MKFRILLYIFYFLVFIFRTGKYEFFLGRARVSMIANIDNSLLNLGGYFSASAEYRALQFWPRNVRLKYTKTPSIFQQKIAAKDDEAQLIRVASASIYYHAFPHTSSIFLASIY